MGLLRKSTSKLLVFVFCVTLIYSLVLYGKVKRTSTTHSSPLMTKQRDEPRVISKNRRRLFDEYRLTNLKMFKPLNPPRKLFQFVMEPHAVRAETPNELKGKDVKLTMITAIKSHYNHFERRDAIRKSWGSIRYLYGVRMEVLFTIALPESPDVQWRLKDESEKFGDLLQVRMNETYSDIGLKALASMQWISDHFPSNFLYFSGDDDIIPGFEEFPIVLRKMIEKANDSGNFEKKLPIFCAYIYGGLMGPERIGKWNVSKEEYPYRSYPSMCLGGFYGMSVKLAKSIYSASRYYPYFRMDDVFITAFMRLKVCDTYEENEFKFDRTSKTCAIATFKCPGFLHGNFTNDQFINTWKEREERLMIPKPQEVIKIHRD